MLVKKLSVLFATGVALAIATPSEAAVTIVTGTSTTFNIGGSTTINYDGQHDGTILSGVSSSLFLQLTGQTTTSATFHFIITDNASSTPSRLSTFGFDADPNITSATTTSLVYPWTSSGSISNSNSVEFCFTAKSNCAGGGGGGIFQGQSTSGDFTLNYQQFDGPFKLSNFVVRYQDFPSPYGSGIGVPTGAVPEPATWAMMLLGFGAMGVSLRRSRRRLGKRMRVA